METKKTKPYVKVDYNCDNGQLAQIIIPKNASEDDICALREMFEVIVARRFKENKNGKS